MNFFRVLLFLLISSSISAQKTSADTIVQEYSTPYKPAIISLFKNNSRIASTEAKYSDMIFENLETGEYRLVFDGVGQSSIRKEIIYVKPGQNLRIHIKLNGPCIYTYPPGYVPECPKKHTDKILPIVYGLLALRKGDEKKLHPGGCMVSDCDPMYYCEIHQISF